MAEEPEMTLQEIHDGYRHKLDDLKGRVRGDCEQLRYWLQTALDAAGIEPPALQAIVERVEDSLKLIRKLYDDFEVKLNA